jgi:hypothetical protein
MSDPHETPAAPLTDAHAPDPHAGPAGPDEGTHGDGGHGDGSHGHEGMQLGPIDWPMWGVGILGVVVALIVTAGFVVATSFQFNA